MCKYTKISSISELKLLCLLNVEKRAIWLFA